jgi:hypothetical protein
LIQNYEGWEKRGWVEEMGMFWQLGHVVKKHTLT